MACTVKQKETKLANYQMVLLPANVQRDAPRYLFIRANPMCQGTNLDPITKQYNKPHSVTHVGDMMSNTRPPRTMMMQQKQQSEYGGEWKSSQYGAHQSAGSSDTRNQWDFGKAWKNTWCSAGSAQWSDWSQTKKD